ncbi:MAG TPA: AMP-binding protein [Actinomycetes bacterium]|nr:AMP-binding protein [Actinomycetes bacterium]
MNPLADLLLAQGRRAPGRTWVEQPDGRTWTYADLDHASASMAHVLTELGVGPGDRVGVQAEKSVELLALHVACVRAGAVYVPMNTAYTPTEVSALVADAEPALLVRDASLPGGDRAVPLADLVAASSGRPSSFDDVDRGADDPAAMLFTSGTTGRPKAAVLSHANLVASARTLMSAWELTATDVLVHMLPLFHTHGLFVAAHTATVAGARIVLLAAFSPDAVIDALPGATVLMGVPTHYVRLLAEPRLTAEPCARMRLFTSGSAPMLLATHQEFTARTGHVIVERYGMTETCMLTSNPLHGERRVGTVGPALPGVEVRVDGSPGAVEVRGPNVFGGYWHRPDADAEAFTDDGWFRTGDLGELDADGYLRLVGRSKDLVITGGLNVYPKEVEEVLDALPGVLESAVVGIPDPDLGEAVTAAVVARPGADLDPDSLRLLARERLAGFKVPKRVVVLPELPRNAMGKVQKALLRQQLGSL